MKKARTRGPAKSRAPSGRKARQDDNTIKTMDDFRMAVASVRGEPFLRERAIFVSGVYIGHTGATGRPSSNRLLSKLVYEVADAEVRLSKGERHGMDPGLLACAEDNLRQMVEVGETGLFLDIMELYVPLLRRLVGTSAVVVHGGVQ